MDDELAFALAKFLMDGGAGMPKGGAASDDSEMTKLIAMLDEAGIPYQAGPAMFGNQVCYYGAKGQPEAEPGTIRGRGVGAVVSVIDYGYGHEEGLLEAMGLDWDAQGHLHAEEIFEGIKKHWDAEEK